MSLLGDRFNQVRLELGLSVKDFAKEIGFSPSMVSLWELGKRVPSQKAVFAVKKAFDVEESYLEGGFGKMFRVEPKKDDKESRILESLFLGLPYKQKEIVFDLAKRYFAKDAWQEKKKRARTQN